MNTTRMESIRRNILTVLLCFLMLATGLPDHNNSLARGTAPVSCGEMKLGVTTISDIIKQHGRPTTRSLKLDEGYPDRGTIEYIWNGNDLQRIVSTHFIGKDETPVYSIELERKNSKRADLCVFSLGTHIDQVIKEYGNAARITASYPSGVPSSFEIQWKNGTTLKGTADKRGEIFYLHLLSPID